MDSTKEDDGLGRLRAITKTDPTDRLVEQLAVVLDEALVGMIRNSQSGRGKGLRECGFMATADELGL